MYITVWGHDPFFINAREIYIYTVYILYIYNTPTAKIDGQKKSKGKLNLRWDFSLVSPTHIHQPFYFDQIDPMCLAHMWHM